MRKQALSPGQNVPFAQGICQPLRCQVEWEMEGKAAGERCVMLVQKQASRRRLGKQVTAGAVCAAERRIRSDVEASDRKQREWRVQRR